MCTSRQEVQAHPAVRQASGCVHFSPRQVEGQQPAGGHCGHSSSLVVQGPGASARLE